MKNRKKALNELAQILGKEKILADPDILSAYAADETSDLSHMPDLLIRAESTDDVSKVMAICSKHKIPVTPRGGGSGVTGGAVPTSGGVLLSLEKMNRILEIDTANMVAVVEPGVITGDLQRAAREEGLFYPPDPSSMDICSIGGNVAEIAGGPGAVKYGTTKDYVLGLEFVLPDGSVIETGGKFVKNATGYNLIGILVGSEGTLAVITKIYCRLIPAPKYTLDLLVPFPSLEQAVDSVTAILRNRVIPSTIEFMEEDAIQLVAKHYGSEIPHPEARAHLLIQIDGISEERIHEELESIVSTVDADPDSILVAESPIHHERLWKARRSIRDAIHEESPVFLAEDCVVPRSEIPSFLKEIKRYLGEKNLRSIMFGHAGDGNVHIDVLKDDISYEDWMNLVPKLKREIYTRAIAAGGNITGEHGIGYTRKEYLSMALSRNEIDLLKRIKGAFDPFNILNPGKVLAD